MDEYKHIPVLLNAYDPIFITLMGMVIVSREEHPPNAASPIVIILFGMVIDLSEEQPLKASFEMRITL